MDEEEIKEALADQAEYRETLLALQQSKPVLFKSVMLEGKSTPTLATKFYIERVGGARVMRMLPDGYRI